MKIGPVDLDREVLVVAEIGNNHEGDVGLAERLIHLAADAGAQAVKFQTIVPEELVAPDQEARLQQLRRFALSADDHKRLAAAADRAGVVFFSTPFSLGAVDLLNPLVPAFKVASGDNDFAPLLAAIADTGKPIILSTGMASLAQIDEARCTIHDRWSAKGVEPGLALLHCVSAYPCPPDQANLLRMNALRRFNETIGYSDHTQGVDAALLAVALGARIVEKHFTISKTHSSFRDHQLSADPAEMATLVRRIRETVAFLGSGSPDPMPAEVATAQAARRSICARRDLPEGHTLTLEDLTWLRPAGGITPGATAQIVGRRLRRAVRRGEQIGRDATT